MVNKNQNQLIEEINIEDEPIQIPKKLSMDEFNKKIDSALEQEQEHQDKISKEKTENNLKEKSNKKKGKEEDMKTLKEKFFQSKKKNEYL